MVIGCCVKTPSALWGLHLFSEMQQTGSFRILLGAFRAPCIQAKPIGCMIRQQRNISHIPGSLPVLQYRIRPISCRITAFSALGHLIRASIDYRSIQLEPSKQSSTVINHQLLSTSRKSAQITHPARTTLISMKFSACAFYIACCLRFVQLVIYFAPILFVFPFYLMGSIEPNTFYRLLRRTLEISGPAFTKLGQWASTRPDIFSRELSDELSILHDKVSVSHSLADTKRIIEQNFGPNFLGQIIDEATISAQVIGSGCIAQVHRAKLVNEDRWVAIKVRHAGVASSTAKDLAIMRGVAWLIDLIPTMEWISLPEEVEEFAISMTQQLNFLDEAANLMQFRENFSDYKHMIIFPRPLYPYVTEEVLVEDFESGITFVSSSYDIIIHY
jgi:hypothetical protein